MRPEIPTITVGDLLSHLAELPESAEISFSGLRFYRVKQRAENLYQIEFEQTVYLNESGRVVVQNHE